MSKYVHKSHNVFILIYHFVCPAKYRKVIVNKEVDETLKGICLEISNLWDNTEFNIRPGSVRDKPELEIFECVSCGLVFLSSFDHIKDGFYENSEMHGKDALDIQAWVRETEWDDERRFQYLKLALPNKRLLDFGCGTNGFLLKA